MFAQAELAKQKNCLACHAADKKLVGPSYKDVAAKYKGDKDAAAKLAKKIREGGVGVWGQVPMPANPQVNEQEAACAGQVGPVAVSLADHPFRRGAQRPVFFVLGQRSQLAHGRAWQRNAGARCR